MKERPTQILQPLMTMVFAVALSMAIAMFIPIWNVQRCLERQTG